MSDQSASVLPILEGISGIAGDYDVILSDVWGVVHNGRQHFAEACAALRRFRDNGGAVILITNAPRPSPPVREQLRGLKVPEGTFDDIVTSGDVTLAFIAERNASPLHHIGPPRDLTLFDILEEQTGLRPPLVDIEEAEYVVCTGLFDDDHTPEEYDRELAIMRERGMVMISANPDLVVHVGERELYCSGAIAHRYEEQGGKVLQAGKPFAPIYDRALELAGQHLGRQADQARVLAIGDAMRTDIRGAEDRGLHSLFVTRGIHRAEMHPPGPDGDPGGIDIAALNALVAATGLRPVGAIDMLRW